MTMRVAFVGFGEVAAAFSGALEERGAVISAYDVLVGESGGLDRLRARAGGVEVAFRTLPEALSGARYILSTVTTSVALEAARACAAYLTSGQTYVDFQRDQPGCEAGDRADRYADRRDFRRGGGSRGGRRYRRENRDPAGRAARGGARSVTLPARWG